MGDTTNLDIEENVNILIKNFYEFPTTDTDKEWYTETTVPFNNYLFGDDIFIESIPKNPDFNNGTPREAHEVGLVSGDFFDYSYNISDPNSCSIVDDASGIITRYRFLRLEPCPLQLGTPTSYYRTDNLNNIVTSDSFQFNYNINNTDNPQPYEYTIYTEKSVVDLKLLPSGKKGGNYSFNYKTGILLFADINNFTNGVQTDPSFKVNHISNVPVMTFCKYRGLKGIKNLAPILNNLSPSLHTLTVSNNLIVLDDTSLNTLTANDVSFNTLNIYNTLTVSNELHLNTIKSYNKNSSIDDTFEPINTYTNILDLTDFSDIIYTTGSSNKRSINDLDDKFTLLEASFNILNEDVKTDISNIDISFKSISVRFTDMERNLSDLSNNLNDFSLNLNDNIRDLSSNLTQFINDFNSPTQNLNDLIEISNNNNIKTTDISQILAHDKLIKDCSNIIYIDISYNNSNNNNVLVNVNLNYRCSYAYAERIKIFLFKDDQINIGGKKLLESSYLGTEMGTNYQGNYSCSYLDNTDFHNNSTKYYIKFQLEDYHGHGYGQGIIDISSSASISAINFNF